MQSESALVLYFPICWANKRLSIVLLHYLAKRRDTKLHLFIQILYYCTARLPPVIGLICSALSHATPAHAAVWLLKSMLLKDKIVVNNVLIASYVCWDSKIFQQYYPLTFTPGLMRKNNCPFYIHLYSPFRWKKRQANKQQEKIEKKHTKILI